MTYTILAIPLRGIAYFWVVKSYVQEPDLKSKYVNVGCELSWVRRLPNGEPPYVVNCRGDTV